MFNTLLFGIGISQFQLETIDNQKILNLVRIKKSQDIRDLECFDENFSELNSIVIKRCQEILDLTAKGHTASIKKMWCNHNINKDIDTPHNHRNSFLSCVYYPLSTDGVIQFYSPFSDYFMSHIPNSSVEELNCYNASYFNLPVHTGDLIIFNSMLYHRALAGFDERISIAYDVTL